LTDGRDWEEGFCDGLVQSRVFIALLSEAALYPPPPKPGRAARGDVSALTPDSGCDNVVHSFAFASSRGALSTPRSLQVLEHAMVLELVERQLIECVVPVLMDAVSAENAADVSVRAIDSKLARHLEREGLGHPKIPHRKVKEIVSAILAPGP